MSVRGEEPQGASMSMMSSWSEWIQKPARQWCLVALACMLLVLQALPLLTTRWVEDESWLSIPAYTLMSEGRLRLPMFAGVGFKGAVEHDVTVYPPATMIITAGFFKCFGVGVVQARIPRILSGIGVVVLTFLVARQVAGPSVAVASAFLTASDNLLWLSSRTARPEIFVVLLGLLALYLWQRSAACQRTWIAFLAGGAIGLALASHPYGLAMGFAIGVLSLMEWRMGVWRQSRAWAFAVGMILFYLPYLLWAHSGEQHRLSYSVLYGLNSFERGIRFLLHKELLRYVDFLQMPYRIHVGLIAVISFVVLFFHERRLFWWLLVIVLAHLLFLFIGINTSVRYMVQVSPLLAMAVAAATVALARKRRWVKVAVVACLLYGTSQVAGNALVLYKFRKADYVEVGNSLRQLIPAEKSAYGSVVFALTFCDRKYYAYDRTPFDQAVGRLHADYLILHDRVMMKGSEHGRNEWADLCAKANAFVHEHAERVGCVSNVFYGNLDVYRVRYPVDETVDLRK